MVIRKSTPIFTPGLRCDYCRMPTAYCLLPTGGPDAHISLLG